jgi:hypothetical protein
MADLSITAANVLKSATAQVATGVAGASITAGQTLYVDAGDSNKLKLCMTTSTRYAVAGIALHAAASGQPISYVTRDPEFTIGATVAVGIPYGVSDTAGGIAPMSDNGTGDYATFVGIGISTTKIAVLADSILRAGAAKS